MHSKACCIVQHTCKGNGSCLLMLALGQLGAAVAGLLSTSLNNTTSCSTPKAAQSFYMTGSLHSKAHSNNVMYPCRGSVLAVAFSLGQLGVAVAGLVSTQLSNSAPSSSSAAAQPFNRTGILLESLQGVCKQPLLEQHVAGPLVAALLGHVQVKS